MKITSTAFQHNENIPAKYTCDGQNFNPPLTFSEIPQEAKSLVLIVDDPDATSGKTFLHWLLYNMPPATMKILENSVPENCVVGMTDFGKTGWGGPCPPSGTHRYFFKLFALDVMLDVANGATREEVEKEMRSHIIATAEIIGLYKRS